MAKRKSRYDQSFPSESERNLQLAVKELQQHNVELRAELEIERSQVRQLKRGSSVETKKIRDEEQKKASIAIKDLKMKLLSEKQRELEGLKENLREKYDGEYQKQIKQKEGEIQKLRTDIKKLQEELQNRGLSGTARDTSFDLERGKITQELTDLRSVKRELEESLDRMKAGDRQMVYDMQRMEESHKTELARLNHDAENEVRKLIDEIKAKNRVISHMEKELGLQSGHYERMQMEKETIRDLLHQTREAESWEKRSPKANTSLNSSFGDLPVMDSPSKEEEKKMNKIADLNSQIKKLEEKCASLAQDKSDLLRKIKEVEKKNKPTLDKNKRFLEKNMELTSINRNLEERIKNLTEESNKMRMKIEHNKKEHQKLSKQLSVEKQDKQSYESIFEELDELKKSSEEQDKTVEALKQTNLEKDRRIELIQHRRRRQRINKQQQKVVRFKLPYSKIIVAAGIKETYYGYDEDSRSVDSEVSASSNGMSYDDVDDDFWDEFTREEYEKNYQRLVREHLELEKSYALLQGQYGSSHTDPQREIKDTSWMDEKQVLNTTNRMLRDRVKKLELQEKNIEHDLQEVREQNEVLEFRVLELEECHDKLAEEMKTTITFQYPPTLTDDGVLQMMADEIGLTEIQIDELKEGICNLKYNQDSNLSRDEKIICLQARAMLDIADKKLRDVTHSQVALKERLHILESEKAELLSSATGMSTDLVLEHESTRNKLMDADLKIKQLEDDIGDMKKSEAVYKYTQDFGVRTEERYRSEISDLKKQLSSSYEGRDYESEIFQEKMDQLRIAEQKMAELEVANKDLEDRLSMLQRQNSDLQDQLNIQQDDQSLTESDKDMSSLLHNLRVRLSQSEKSEKEVSEKNRGLHHELANMRAKLAEYETIETQFTERNMTLRENFAGAKKLNKSLTDELDKVKSELEQSKPQVGAILDSLTLTRTNNDLEGDNRQLRTEVFMLKEQLGNKNSELDKLKISLEKEMAALKQENSALKKKLRDKTTELISKDDDLNNSLDSNVDMENKILELEVDIEKFRDQVNSGTVGEISPLRQKIDELTLSERALKERVLDLETSETVLKENVEMLVKKDISARRQIEELQNSEQELKEQLTEKEESEVTREEKLKVLEQSEQNLLASIEELEESKRCLQDLVQELEGDKQDLLGRIDELEENEELLGQELQSSLDEEVRNREELQETMQVLELENRDLKDRVEELTHDQEQYAKIQNNGTGNQLGFESETTLKEQKEKIEELEEKNMQWEDKFEMMVEEKMRQIETLRQQIEQMEEHELRLTETIVELEENEEATKKKLNEYETSDFGPSKVKILEEKISRLESGKQNLSDKLEQMEMNEQLLRKQLDENERSKQEVTSQGAGEQSNQTYTQQIKELQGQVEHLEARESKLMEKVYQAQLTEQELIEQLEEYENNAKTMSTAEFDPEEFADYGKSPKELKDKIDLLQAEKQELASHVVQLEEEKDALSSEISELEDTKHKHKLNFNELQAQHQENMDSVVNLGQQIQELVAEKEKLSAKTDSEKSELSSQIESLKAEKEELSNKMKEIDNLHKEQQNSYVQLQKQYKESVNSVAEMGAELQQISKEKEKLVIKMEKIKQASVVDQAAVVENLSEQFGQVKTENGRLQERIKQLKFELEEKNQSEVHLKEKVELLSESEGKLMDRVMELEEATESMKETLVTKDTEDNLTERVADFQHIEHELKGKVRELEQSKASLKEQLVKYQNFENRDVEHMQKKIDLLIQSEENLLDRLSQQETVEKKLKDKLDKAEREQEYSDKKIEELEASEKVLKQRINELKQREPISESVDRMNGSNMPLVSKQSLVNNNIIPVQSSSLQTSSTTLPSSSHSSNYTATALPLHDQKRSTFAELEEMGKIELVSRVQELESMNNIYRAKIKELDSNLVTLRQAVETVAYTMDTNADIPVSPSRTEAKKCDSELQESEYERKVHELVRSEVSLKLRVFTLERKEAEHRTNSQDKEDRIKLVMEDYKTQLDELEEELHKSRKSEARLKNKLEYGSHSQENQALAKIQLLEGQLFDLETSEKKLKRKVLELEQRERELQEVLDDAEHAREGHIFSFDISKDQQQRDEFYNLLEQVKLLESSDQNLKDKIQRLEKQPDSSDLQWRLDQAERAEKALLLKVDLLENNDSSCHLDNTMLDTPEAILKQHIRELEKMEKHLKQQVAELERDREELHEIARKDKNVVHELNVQIRELQLLVQNLKEQLNRYDIKEASLQDRVDSLLERIQELEDVIKEMQTNEKEIRDKMYQYKYGESSINAKVVHMQQTIDDMQNTEQKLKVKIKDLEAEKKVLADKVDELTDRLGDLEGTELSLKQKLRHVEHNDVSLQGKIAQLELSEKQCRKRANDLENINESLSQKLRIFEEEKSTLTYEVSDLKIEKDEFTLLKDQLNNTIKNLKSQNDELQTGGAKTKQQVHEHQIKEIELQGRLRELERVEYHLKDKINLLEGNEENLKERILKLDANVSTAENKASSAGGLEAENGQLYLQIEHTHQRIDELENFTKSLQGKLNRYETSHANNDMAVVPRAELTELRAQVKLLEETEKTVVKMEKQEANLKQAVAKLREGKDACGHEAELEELKTKVNRYNVLIQANRELKEQQNGSRPHGSVQSVGSSAPIRTSSEHKSTQTKKAAALHTTPEFKKALQQLHSTHPEAYKEITKSLPKVPTGRAVSTPIASRQHAVTMATKTHPVTMVHEDVIVPQEINAAEVQTTTTVHVSNRKELIEEFVSALPSGDVSTRQDEEDSDSSLDESPVAGGKQRIKHVRPIDAASNTQKAAMISELVENMPDGEVRPLVRNKGYAEEAEWQKVERQASFEGQQPGEGRVRENSLWANIEKSKDDMALGMQFKDEVAWSDIASEDEEVDQSANNLVAPPPLPNTRPPPSPNGLQHQDTSFYLPDAASADEASDIEEDGTVPPPLGKRRSQSKSPSRKGPLGRLSGSLDSIADSGMGTMHTSDVSTGLNTPVVGNHRKSEEKLDVKSLMEKVSQLEKQIKLKDKELDIAHINRKEWEKKAKEEDNSTSKPAQLREKARQLQLELIVNRDLNVQIETLEKQEADKDKKIRELEIEMKNLNREIRAKELASIPSPAASRVAEQSVNTFQLQKPDSESGSPEYQLERRNKELTAKTNEVDRLTKELRKWQEESRSAKDEKYVLERQLKFAQAKLDKLKNAENDLHKMTQSYDSLKKEFDEIKEKNESLEHADAQRSILEKKTSQLNSQLSDLDRIALERQDMENRLTASQNQLKDKVKYESEVTKENVQLKHAIDKLEKDKQRYDQLVKDYQLIRTKYEEMEKVKTKAHMSVAPLRAKVLRLAHKCQQKDELIKKLSSELRRLNAGEPSRLLAEADRDQAKSSSEEYNRPLSPLNMDGSPEAFQEEMTESRAFVINKYPSSQDHARLRHKSDSSGGSSDHSFDLLDPLTRDILNGFDTRSDSLLTTTIPRSSSMGDGLSRERRSQRLNGFASTESLPQLSTAPMSQLNNERLSAPQSRSDSRGSNRSRNGRESNRQNNSMPSTDTFKAVKDYNPEQFSYSGHPRLELSLKEGDEVKVLGPVDEKGYYEAQVNGQIGLVPAKYLSPVYPKDTTNLHTTRKQRHKQHLPGHWDTSPEQILEMHDHLQHAHTPHHNVAHVSTSAHTNRLPSGLMHTHNGSITHPAFLRSPVVPTLSAPIMAGTHPAFHPQTNGQVSGLHNLLSHGRPSSRPSSVVLSPTTSVSSRPGVQQPSHHSSAHSLSSNHERPVKEGPPDPPTQFHIQCTVGKHGVVLRWCPPAMDAMARNNGSVVTGYKIYIDGREKQSVSSPHLTKALVEKLDLRRPHHFAIHTITENNQSSKRAEVNYEIPPETASDLVSDRESAGDGDVSSVLSSSCYGDGERRVFMAVYDYNPAEHSPNSYPAHELAFRTGEIITTYGPPRPDGFYHGKVHGKKGLVPASFMEEVAVSRSRSVKSLSTSTLNSSLASSRISGERVHGASRRPHSHHRNRHMSAQV